MTLFIDLRATASGGICARDASIWDGDTLLPNPRTFAARVRGRDLLLATHGFNVSRAHGVAALSAWEPLCQLPASALFVGVLWAGDSRYMPVLDYPLEGNEAIASGKLLAEFLNRHSRDAASLSLVSHSLGARVVLETLRHLDRPVRRLILMAGAIENDCLEKEYQDAAAQAAQISVLASRSDWVLQLAFPIGNLGGEILMRGHPYRRTALGREGPDRPIPIEQRGDVWQIPDGWKYRHGDYLPGGPGGAQSAVPVPLPAPNAPAPSNAPDWKPSWSAGVVSTEY